ncbi:MAG: histidinol-phosphatase [Planctomycetes bacterium]|nr:histidinol-phosphatase [Planctomycetota bacterium]
MPTDELSTRLDLAVAAAREAGEVTLRYFRRDNFQVERKSDSSPVTVADREAEQHLRQRIAAAFPDDAILGEELGEKSGTSGYRWILDPIDGTKSFIHGVPLYGTLIGVERQGRSVLGVINVPVLDERVYAAAGQGAWYQSGNAAPRRAKVSAVPRLAEALFLTSEVEGFTLANRYAVFQRLQEAAWLTRTWGDCYGYLLVATGRAEAMVDPRMQVWDAAGLQPILEEAGGTFTDWQGQPTIYSGNGVATNGKVTPEVLAITNATV